MTDVINIKSFFIVEYKQYIWYHNYIINPNLISFRLHFFHITL